MKTYESHKVVKAQPMTRLEYNELRGWAVPGDEDGSDAGYLVEYTDGRMMNDGIQAQTVGNDLAHLGAVLSVARPAL